MPTAPSNEPTEVTARARRFGRPTWMLACAMLVLLLVSGAILTAFAIQRSSGHSRGTVASSSHERDSSGSSMGGAGSDERLSAELIVRVWSQEEKRGARIGEDLLAVPVREDEQLHIDKKPLGKLEALRQAQLYVLKNPEKVIERTKELRAELAKRGIGRRPARPQGQRRPGAARQRRDQAGR